MRLNRLVVLSTVAIIPFALASACKADLLFDNGNHVQNGGLASRDDPGNVYHEADHFQLPSSAVITALTWKGFYGSSLPPGDNFEVFIYSDNGAGTPTSPPVTGAIYSGVATITDRHLTGEINGSEIFYQYSANVPAFNAIGGMQYWLEIHNNIKSGWSWADELQVPGGKQYFAVEDGILFNWTNNGFNSEATFQLFGTPVPEPSTLMLLALGAVGLAVMRRLSPKWPPSMNRTDVARRR